MKGHGKAKEGGWPPKDKVGASLLKSLNSSSYLRGVSTPNYHFFSRRNCVRRSSYNTPRVFGQLLAEIDRRFTPDTELDSRGMQHENDS